MDDIARFDQARERIRRMARHGQPLSDIEREIESIELPEDDRAALWLFAWIVGDDPTRHRELEPAAS